MVSRGFLVSGALILLIMPPDIPLDTWRFLWHLPYGSGKEAFGGTGMNVLNIALLARVFVFFCHPTYISGDECGLPPCRAWRQYGAAADYGWIHFSVFNPLFEALTPSGAQPRFWLWLTAIPALRPLEPASHSGWEHVTEAYTDAQDVVEASIATGSIGETSKPLIIPAHCISATTKIADWRIMLSAVVGAAHTALSQRLGATSPWRRQPWYYQFHMGSFWFAIAFIPPRPGNRQCQFQASGYMDF